MKMNKLLSLLLLMCLSLSGMAQSYKFLSAEDGLSNSLINKILQDQYGFIWIATEDGLNCYDGNRIKVYRHNDADSTSLANNFIRDIFIDSRGRLFVGTYKGIQVYNPLTDSFSLPARNSDGDVFIFSVMSFVELSDSTLIALGDLPCTIEVDRTGNLIVKPYILPQRTSVHPIDFMVEAPNGSLFVADNRGELIRTDKNSVHNYSSGVRSSTLFKNPYGDIFACSDNNDFFKYNADTDSFECLVQGNGDLPYYNCRWLNDDKVLACTDGNGLKIIDLQQKTVSHVSMSVPFFDDSKLKVHSALIDSCGNIWLGLYQKGILALNPEKSVFNYIGHKSATDNIIGQNCVSALTFCNGLLWVATDNDGVYVTDLATKRIVHHFLGGGFPQLVMSLYAVDDRYVYLGSFGSGLWKIDAKTYEFKRVPLSDEVNRLNFSRLSHINRLDDNTLIIASLGSGVGFVDIKTDKQLFFKNITLNCNLWSSCVEKLSENSFVSGSYNGIYFADNFKQKGVFKHIFDRVIIFSLLAIDNSRIAAATSNGFFILKKDSVSDLYQTISLSGTADAAFYSLTKDNDGNIWAGTDRGLYRITHQGGDDYTATRFSTDDGTVNIEFTKNAVCVSQDGMLYFGGLDGITYFKPKDMRKLSFGASGVRVTRFWIRNHPIKAMDNTLKNTVIDRPACSAKVFELLHDQNSFTIEFSPLDFFTSPDTRYYYTVNNDAPVRIGRGNRQLSFIRLAPDEYNISIYSITNGVESPKYTVKIIIHPAWYNTIGAWVAYVLLIAAVVASVLFVVYRHRKSKQVIAKQLELQQDNQIKLRFFTNVIHEIRTPLSLIVSPLQKVVSAEPDSKYKTEFRTICLGVDRMRRLVDSLLDIRKIDNGKMVLHFANYQLEPIITGNIEFFELKAGSKNVQLTFKNNLPEGYSLVTDNTAVEKIITNLLSNAMKFCADGGEIEVTAAIDGDNVKISVSDCGPGINENDIDKIFDRFYQAESPYIQQGTGIGLHLSKNLAELLGGSLTVQNRTDRTGSVFTFVHPLGLKPSIPSSTKTEDSQETLQTPLVQNAPADSQVKKANTKSVSGKKRIVLVEDDYDIANYLISEFKTDYLVSHFDNCEAALSDIMSNAPELVITDLMLPDFDGFALCKRIKQNINVNEIPVVILTAKTGDDVEMSSLQAGADAFISKPFNIDLLKQTVKNLINVRHKLIVNYSGAQQPKDTTDLDQYEDPEEKLIKRIVKAVEKNISNAEYSTEMLAADVGLSRVHLYRKLKDLTNQTGSEFIRNIRLKRASELILNRKGFSIAEVADMVGFPNTAYFCTAFRNFFGTNPTAWREMHSGDQEESDDTENS